MSRLNLLSSFLLLALAPLSGYAESIPDPEWERELQKRPVRGLYSIELGRMEAVSRYLSPVEYGGFRLGLSGEWTKLLPQRPENWRIYFEGGVGGAMGLLNPHGTASMQGIDINFSWHCAAYWRLPEGFTISVGPGITTEAGILALLKNSNNPVSVNIMAAASGRADLRWDTKIKQLPVTGRLSLSIPVAGAFFMPGYGETYYEISLGNRKHLVHPLWPGNYPQFDLRASIALDFGKTAMEFGYHLNWRRATANNLVERVSNNMFFIGIIPGGGR